jgi:hypothetical protein
MPPSYQKFAGGAAWCGVSVALNGRNWDGTVRICGYTENRYYTQNKTWVRQRAMAGDGNASEGYAGIAEGGRKMVGLGRLELPTSPLSGVRSSHLSYRPNLLAGNILRDLRRSSNNGGASVAQLARIYSIAARLQRPAITPGMANQYGNHKQTVIFLADFGP